MQPNDWTDAEDKVLVTLYPNGGAKACARFLPGRSMGAIYKRAATLGIVRRHHLIRSEHALARFDGTPLNDVETLRAIRHAAGVCQHGAARYAGIHTNTLSMIEGHNNNGVRFATVLGLLELYGFELVLRRRQNQ